MSDLKKLRESAKDLSLLFVEDNDALRNNASKLLKKLFDTVYIARDGEEGLAIFKEKKPPILITDIKMPHMDGIELIKHIKDIQPQTKLIIMSAFDDRENLYNSIELGIFRFLKKPVSISELSEILHLAVKEIQDEDQNNLFNNYLKTIFNTQSSMVMMLKDQKAILANQVFLDFFNVADIDEFIEEYADLGNSFLEHGGFLYNKADKSWFDEISENENKLFHVKLKNNDEDLEHFILKYQKTNDEDSYGILSLDNVTELHLLKLFDAKRAKNDDSIKDTKSMFNLLEIIHKNGAKVELHNYYKGLSIVHDAVIMEVKDDSIILQTEYMQEKAIQYEEKTILISDALPHPVVCNKISNLSFQKESIECKNINFIASSPISRKTIRLAPEDEHTVSLFINENKFQGETRIEDISLDAVKLNLNAMPAGLKKDDEVVIDMILTNDKRPIIINTKAKLFRTSENKRSFSLVFIFEFKNTQKHDLTEYITNRQMAIIREFKSL